MGNALSSRGRSWQIQQPPQAPAPAPPGYPTTPAGAPTYIPYYHTGSHNGPHGRVPYYPQGYVPTNGQFYMSMPTGSFNQVAPCTPSTSSPSVSCVVEKNINTIQNEINVKKTTVRLEKDEQNPGFYLVTFIFDATMPGSICIFFYSKEGPEFSLIPLKPHSFKPVRVPFDKGLGQVFRQAPGTGIDLSIFEPSDITEVRNNEIFPLVVRMETNPSNFSSDAEQKPAGAPIPKSINAQMTHCVLGSKGDDYPIKVVKQIIWVAGMRYELQEIYGIENVDGGGGIDSSDFGKECVICLSEPRDTTVLPCRHMCMCSGCAKMLQCRTNRCPICRTPVEKLLEIKIPKQEQAMV